MKRAAVLLVVVLLTVGTATPADVDGSESHKKPDKGYLKRTFSPNSVVMSAAGAGLAQATDTPHEWGQGAVGFGRRFANSYGKHIIQRTIQYPIARLLHEEISYRRSEKTGFGPRLKYALTSVVITHKTTTDARTVAVGEIAGSVGSGLISRLWQPASTRSIAMGFGSAGISLGADAGLNVVREFWPEIRHPHRHNAPASPVTTPSAASVNNEPFSEVVVLDANGSLVEREQQQ
jgi:hypothetical protein